MSKRLIVLFLLLCMVIGLSGCNFSVRDTVEGKDTTLPPLRIDSSLVCSVTSIEGNRCFAVVLEGNNNYDKDDTVYITYDSVKKDQSVKSGDVITLDYNYVTDVSAYKDRPHIHTDEVAIVKDYKPSAE